jgi:hypothetical protein
MNKICYNCNKDKDKSLFYKGSKNCKECHSKIMKDFRVNNPKVTRLVELLDGEIWRNVIGLEKYYRVSSLGRISSLCKSVRGKAYPRTVEKILKQYLDKTSGYYAYCFSQFGEGKDIRYTIHRLVAIHFIPNPENKPEVNHIGKDANGVVTKLDNRACSLEWVTRPENIQHGFMNGLIKTLKGEEAYNSTLTNEQVLYIFNHKGSPRQLSRDLNMPYSKIASIRNGTSWNHITGAAKKYYGKNKDKPKFT